MLQYLAIPILPMIGRDYTLIPRQTRSLRMNEKLIVNHCQSRYIRFVLCHRRRRIRVTIHLGWLGDPHTTRPFLPRVSNNVWIPGGHAVQTLVRRWASIFKDG